MSVALAWTILEIFNWVLLGYFIAINGVYLVTSIFAFRAMLHYTRRLKALDAVQVTAGIEPPITLIAPAYNEEDTCVESMRSFLNLTYPDLEVMVVNDGSTDATLARLRAAYQLVPAVRFPTAMIPAQPIRGIYRSKNHPQLWVIDKENGGKADALNAGINCCRTPLFAAMDADTLLERDALPRIVRPFLEDTRTGAVGGIIRIVNGCTVKDGVVTEIKLPKSWLARFQAIEYMRAFLSGRMGWDAADSTLIISGAFGVFRRQLVVEAGGYRHDTVGEDMELVVRLHRHCRQEKIPLRIGFVPDPVAWTQAPETVSGLGRQRDRWQRGLTDSLSRHRSMLFNPRYGKIGMLAFPYFYLLEMFGPVIEFCGYFVFVAYGLAQIINPFYAVAFIMVAFFLGVALSLSAVGLGEISFRRYTRRRDLLMLFLLAIIENFGYRQLVNFYRIRGMLSALLRHKKWGKQHRTTFAPALLVAPVTVAAGQAEPVALTSTPVTADETAREVCLVNVSPGMKETVQVVCLAAGPADKSPSFARELDRVLVEGEKRFAVQAMLAAEADRQQEQDEVLTQALATDTARHAMQAEDTERRETLYEEKVQREQARAEWQAQGARAAATTTREDEPVKLEQTLAELQAREQDERAAATTALAHEMAALRAREQAEWQAARTARREQTELAATMKRQRMAVPTPAADKPDLAAHASAQPAEHVASGTVPDPAGRMQEDPLAVHSRLATELDRQRVKHAILTQVLTANAERRATLEQQRRERDRRELALADLQAREQADREAAALTLAKERADLQVREQGERAAATAALEHELAALRAREQAEWEETLTVARREQAELTAELERLRLEEDGLRQQVTVAQPTELAALAAKWNRVRMTREDTLAEHAQLAAELERRRAEHAALTQAMAADAERRAMLDGELARLCAEEADLQNRVAAAQRRTSETERAALSRSLDKDATQRDAAENELTQRGQDLALALTRGETLAGDLAQRAQNLALATTRCEALAVELAQRELALAAQREEEEEEQQQHSVALARQEQAALLAEQERLRRENAAQQQLLATQRHALEQAAHTLSERQAEQVVLTMEIARAEDDRHRQRRETEAGRREMLQVRLDEEKARMRLSELTDKETGLRARLAQLVRTARTQGAGAQQRHLFVESAPAQSAGSPPAPDAAETRYYFNIDGRQYGPATLAELGELARTRRISSHDWIWFNPQQKWVQLRNYLPAAAVINAPEASHPVKSPANAA